MTVALEALSHEPLEISWGYSRDQRVHEPTHRITKVL